MKHESPAIDTPRNPYRDEVQGLVNQPPTVVKLLSRARERLGAGAPLPTQGEVYDRLAANAPRIAIISGSADHVAHVSDDVAIARAATAVWNQGGVPFNFGIPIMCDGAAQNHLGMSYSLFSRNLIAEMAASQMESHAYHAAIVLQGCDKSPMGIACGLAALDRTRRKRGDEPLWATFIPAHVMRGGTLPASTRAALMDLVHRTELGGFMSDAADLRATMEYVVQCTSNDAYNGIFERLEVRGILPGEERASLRRQLATCACGADGGICAFNGTGNSSRVATAALGLAHPATDFLSRPPAQEKMDEAVAGLFNVLNRAEYGVSEIVRRNWANAVRIHSATGGSTNLVLHFVALANYAGMKADVHTYDKARRKTAVPDIFDFSLTEERSHYELAQQCETGSIRGIETIYHELWRHDVPLDLDAPTTTGGTWKKRLKIKTGLSARGVKSNPIILASPRRPTSGIDVLSGNFFESAVIKISGMSDDQLDEFDDQLHVVLYFDNEDEATAALLDPGLIDKFYRQAGLTKNDLLTMLDYNAGKSKANEDLSALPTKQLYDAMVDSGALKIAMIIGGQGPKAFGMPEMFCPMQHINSNRRLKKITTLISDGRYSGVSYGAAVGHLTPEAADEGGVLYLQRGDILRLRLRKRKLEWMDPAAFAKGKVKTLNVVPRKERTTLARRRLAKIKRRGTYVATLCHQEVSDASTGAIPLRILKRK
jgi:dihydroxyacid dehydratase/phosphogluconate dehydratase